MPTLENTGSGRSARARRTPPALLMLAAALALPPAQAQYGGAYRAPDYHRLNQMASQRSRDAMNDHYRRVAPSRSPTTAGAAPGAGSSFGSDRNSWANTSHIDWQNSLAERNRATREAWQSIEQRLEALIRERSLQRTAEFQPRLLQAARDAGMNEDQARRHFGTTPAEYAEMLRLKRLADRPASAYSGSTRAECAAPCSETLTVRDGSTYTGSTLGGRPHGTGTYRLPNGDLITGGTWNEGRLTGPLRIAFANGDVYEGGWAHNNYNGPGTYKQKNGSTHRGYYVEGKLHGEGMRIDTVDGTVFTGSFEADRMAAGRLELGGKQGVFEGQFNAEGDMAFGTLTAPNGNRFTGSFREGVPARGTFRFNDGVVFDGLHDAQGEPAVGRIVFPSGTEWHGRFAKGTKAGYVRAVRKDGHVTEQVYRNNEPAGAGLMTMPNGDTLLGTALPGWTLVGMLTSAADGQVRAAGVRESGQWVTLAPSEHEKAKALADEAQRRLAAERESYRKAIEGD